MPLPIPYNHQPEPAAAPEVVEQSPAVFVTPVSLTTTELQELASEAPPQGLVEAASTGRAVDYRPAYPFGQLITPLIKSGRPQHFSVRPRPSKNRINPMGSRYKAKNGGYKRG